MGIFERTLSLLSSSAENITAFLLPTLNSSTSSRKRTRTISSSASCSFSRKMTLSTFIYISLAVIILSMSPSAYSERCTPIFTPLDENGLEDESSVLNEGVADQDILKKFEFVVREGSMFQLSCHLSMFHSVKWTINNREITPQIQDEWDMNVITWNVVNGFTKTQLTVNNSSTKFHPGEYKCTSVCVYDSPDKFANVGVKITVSTSINVTFNTNITGPPDQNGRVYRKFVAREKRVDIACIAHVPEAIMHWYRIKDDRREEDMESEVCVGHDVELAATRKKPPEHCRVTRERSTENTTTLKLEIKRVRKEGNQTLSTISDFRKYICRVTKEGNQDGSGTVEILERVSATRSFDHRGLKSLTVTEGEELKIYCDIHGVDGKDFASGRVNVVWKKDGEPLEIDESKGMQKIGQQEVEEKGKPYRTGFRYELADTIHRGNYICEVQKQGESNQDAGSGTPVGGVAFASFTYYVRVKDKLGALWPFLGICGEVVILCTIILIYEKRKSKAELEESDTDGSPDQNNSNSNN